MWSPVNARLAQDLVPRKMEAQKTDTHENGSECSATGKAHEKCTGAVHTQNPRLYLTPRCWHIPYTSKVHSPITTKRDAVCRTKETPQSAACRHQMGFGIAQPTHNTGRSSVGDHVLQDERTSMLDLCCPKTTTVPSCRERAQLLQCRATARDAQFA